MVISVEGKVTNQLQPGQEYMGDGPVLSHCDLLKKKSLAKTDQCAGALLWRRSQLLVLHFSAHFLLTASLRHQWMSVYIYLFTAAIPVNFTSEFPKLFEATMYFIKLLSGTTQNNCLNSGWWHHKIIPQALYFLTIEWLGKQSSTSVTVQWHTFCPAPQNTHR